MKRFTETEKWNDPWFRRLEPRIKLLWVYLCDRANSVGIWEPDWEDASFRIGETVGEPDLKAFEDRITKRDDGLFFIPKLLPFQHSKLSYDSHAHTHIFELLKKYGLPIPVPVIGKPKDALTPRPTPKMQGNGAIVAFDRFWIAYPKKQKRYETERVFVEVRAEEHLEGILQALSWQVTQSDWTKEGGRFIPSPDVYLRDGRWHDQPLNVAKRKRPEPTL